MNSEIPMSSRTIDAEEDPVSHRRPRWILRVAIEAHLQKPTIITKRDTPKNQPKNEKPQISDPDNNSTLFSDLARSFLKTAFLSAKLSEPMGPTRNQINRQVETETGWRPALRCRNPYSEFPQRNEGPIEAAAFWNKEDG